MERREDLVGSARTATGSAGGEITTEGSAAAPAAGGAAGAVAGGTAGTLVAGPIGTIVGAIAGAVGGWWMGAAARRGAEITPEDEGYYRAHFEAAPHRDSTWERVRPAYALGHLASENPDYAGRSFAEIEADLQHGWRGETRAAHGDWSAVREMARFAYERRPRPAGGRPETDDIGTTETHRRPPFSDPLAGPPPA